MARTLMSLAALLTAAVLLMLGNGLFSTLLAVRAGIESYSTQMTGVIMAAYFAGLVVGVFWCRSAIRDVGHIRSFAAFAAIMSVLPLGHAFLVHPWAWVVFRGLAGLCIAGLFMVTESWINERASNEMRGRILAVYLTAYYAALAGGQFLLNVGDPRARALFALVSILVSLAIGGGAFALYSVCIAHANDFLSPEQRVDAAGGLLIVYGVGAASGPIVAAAVMGWLGPRGLYLTAGAIQLALLVFAIHRSFSRRTIIRALRRPLVLFPRSSPVITELAQTEPAGGELAGEDLGEAQRT
jgi:MFS family permease